MRSRIRFVMGAAVLLGMAVTLPQAAFAAASPIVAHDLKELRVPNKVSTVLWTRREGYYTLQLVLPTTVRFERAAPGARIVATSPAAQVDVADVQVWLLGADGKLVQPQSTSSPNMKDVRSRNIALESRYSFSLEAGKRALAVAMQVDGKFYIQELEPL